MTEKLLSSESIWDSVLHGSGGPKFAALLRARTSEFMSGAAVNQHTHPLPLPHHARTALALLALAQAVVYSGSDPTAFGGAAHWRGLEERASERILQLLPRELPLAHGYIDGALDLKAPHREHAESTLRARREHIEPSASRRYRPRPHAHLRRRLPPPPTPSHRAPPAWHPVGSGAALIPSRPAGHAQDQPAPPLAARVRGPLAPDLPAGRAHLAPRRHRPRLGRWLRAGRAGRAVEAGRTQR